MVHLSFTYDELMDFAENEECYAAKLAADGDLIGSGYLEAHAMEARQLAREILDQHSK